MKTSVKITSLAALCIGAGVTSTVQAQPDYPIAFWRPPTGCNKYYTSGNGHHFAVIHDMEGYYASGISYLQRCDVSVSIHYMVNGKKDASSDYAAGEITQQIRNANYAWHARCWNTWSYGTEHEGFVSNPAWFTEQMYQCSADLQRYNASVGSSLTKDRNHIIGHDQKRFSAWVTWVNANFSMDPTCNTHNDPGTYWDWTHFMGLIAGTDNSALVSKSIADGTVMSPGQAFTCTFVMTNNGTTAWIGSGANAYTFNYLSGTQMGAPLRTGFGAAFSNVGPGGNTYAGFPTTKSFSVPMTAPTANGTYTANFRLNSTVSTYFGATVSCTIVVGPVNTPPSITTQPASKTVNQGGSATFSVTASGTAPLSYQWRFNGTDISGATLSSYTKSNAQSSDAGNYSVFVSNPYGNVTSANAALTVNVPPSITTEPTSQTVNQGGSATFSVTASGTAPLSYQWTFNGGNISGATGSSYTVSNAQSSNAGNYAVVVSNVAGSATSATASLTVNVPPSITTQPASQTVDAGANVTFTVVATGTTPLTYQWQFNGIDITGATLSSLTLSDVHDTEAGSYTVTVANGVGSVTSSTAVLTVNVFSDNFTAGNLNKWGVAISASSPNATPLTISSTNHTSGGGFSAMVTNSLNKMYHNFGFSVSGHIKMSFWLYDNGSSQIPFCDIRSYNGAGYTTNGAVTQLFAAGKYNTVTMTGETYDSTKYQARVVTGTNTGWFNLNGAGAPSRSVGWHQFTIERASDGSTISFYVDGVLSRTITGATAAPIDSTVIGSTGAGAITGSSWVDDMLIQY